MRNKNKREAGIGLFRLQQVQNIALNGAVQRCYRLITNQHLRPDDKCTCDRDPLRLTPGQLVRIPLTQLNSKPHMPQHLIHILFPLGLLLFGFMNADWLRDDFSNAHCRIQRRHRILENHLELTTNCIRS